MAKPTDSRAAGARPRAPRDAHAAAIRAGRMLSGMSFSQKVWALTARVPRGKVTTYATLARRLGTGACRAVGMALNRNPYAPWVPCHRVVGSDGSLVGFAGGLARKRAMLQAEGVPFIGNKVDLAKGRSRR
jgi:methylated-DNA-[protein]-cysteine S-methyltransferase